MKDKILVTGGTGFIGSYILRELVLKGYRNIHALYRKSSDLRLVEPFKDAITWHLADLHEIDKIYSIVKGSRRVIHAAGLVSFAPQDKDRLYEVNVQGTAVMVNACLEHGIPHLTHMSSIAAITKSSAGSLISEETKWSDNRYTSNYGRTKHFGEMEVWRGIAEGLSATILNPSIVLGAGNWRSSSCRLFKQIYDGLRFYVPGSSGFVDVRDVARIAVNVISSKADNQRFILSEGNYYFKVIFEWIAYGLNVKPPSEQGPRWIAKIMVFMEGIKSFFNKSKPVITSDSVRNAYENFQYSNDRICSLGYTFIPIEETIRETTALLRKASQCDFSPLLLDHHTLRRSNPMK